MARKARNPGVGTGHGERIKKRHECEVCGVEIWAVRSDVRFCYRCMSLRRSRNHEARGKRPCPGCEQPMSRHNATRCRGCEGKLRSIKHLREGNPNWRGGKTRARGYVYIRKLEDGRRYVGEHILVWEQAHGRIPKGWLVHHLNGIRDDNRLENLVAMSRSQHHKNHHEPWERRIRALEEQAYLNGAG